MEAPRLETLKEQVDRLEKEVKTLQKQVDKKVSDRVEAAAKDQARFFLVKFFIPFFEGICEFKGIRMEEAISALIYENRTLDEIFDENLEMTSSLMASPEFRVILTTVRPMADKSNKWIKDNSKILIDVLEEIHPEICTVITDTDGGEKWLFDSLFGIRDLLFKIS